MIDNKPTYVSLFSSAGVGCYGFKIEGFDCIATNELIERRINIQKLNEKCKLPTGYINADITKPETKEQIFEEIEKWKKQGNDGVDVVIATPPCQGMSIANHKKNESDFNRNSLVVESIELIKAIKPKFFIFENVSAFLTTACEAPDKSVKSIEDVINEELGNIYSIASRILNFKNYGSNSSRTRTVVLGVTNAYAEFISPIELYPDYCKEKSLYDIIGDMPKLEWGEFDKDDFFHQFRTYDERMRAWISDLPQGKSAFDNEDLLKRPHRIIDGEVVPNVRKNGDKYTRNCWTSVAPCIHTRNDQLASQNTIHPVEDRVFTIRELMKLMTIPATFRWVKEEDSALKKMTEIEKRKVLKREEINIRQSIGEAVPTVIFQQIANKISTFLQKKRLTDTEILKLIEQEELLQQENLLQFIDKSDSYCISTVSRVIELANSKREKNEAFFTNKSILNEVYKELPDINKDELHILEPSVGCGNFLPYIIKKYESKVKVVIDVFDVDNCMLTALKALVKKYKFPKNVYVNYISADTLKYTFNKEYDLVVGNPPFGNASGDNLKEYTQEVTNTDTKNLASFFLEKAIKCSKYVVMIVPKNFLNTPEYEKTRDYLNTMRVDCILDFGEKGFKGVLVETICFFISTKDKPKTTKIKSLFQKKELIQKQKYITDKRLPYWVIYRDAFFDSVFENMVFNLFTVFRDRQITNSNTTKVKENNIRVLKSRNLSDTGEEILDIEGYDTYIEKEVLEKLSVYKYLEDGCVYLTPNMTYLPRVCLKPIGVVVNGSVAILIPKDKGCLSEEDMLYFSSKEYRTFYKIARNYQTRSLNIDNTSVFFFGKRK